ncbi:MAG: hypothetical protein HY300_18835 [Verrucomicrobia bacterium]|nr:hypothetical protein [Verrucomicrobiota bacterium]
MRATPVHMNATNVRQLIKPQGGTNVIEVIQANVNAVLDQRRRTGVPMFPHLNHPNFGWAVTAEELMQVRGERFFEVYNGHNKVFNFGDTNHPGTDRFWDIVLTWRLGVLGLDVVYGLGTDDSHHYHDINVYKGTNAPVVKNDSPADVAPRDPNRDLTSKCYPGRGWVMVRAPRLAAEDLVAAMEAGDFYASSGVRLRDVRVEPVRYSVEIEPEPGVSYVTQFIGTRKGFDPRHEPVRNAAGDMLRITQRYSRDVGAVLAEVKGPSASYTLKGDEIYVRTKIISSKLKQNPSQLGELETAWTQPLVTGVK